MKISMKNEVTINQDSSYFVGTPLENEKFSITVKRLSRSDKLDVLMASLSDEKNADGDTIIDQARNNKNNFMASVTSFSGFTDEDGNDFPSDEDQAKEFLYEFLPDDIYKAINKATEQLAGVDESIKKPVSDTLEIEQDLE